MYHGDTGKFLFLWEDGLLQNEEVKFGQLFLYGFCKLMCEYNDLLKFSLIEFLQADKFNHLL